MKMQENQIIPNEAIEAAVNWWADSIQSPKFDNGASDETSIFASLFATINAHDSAPNKAKIESFKESLISAIKRDSETRREWDNSILLDVDYHPSGLLKEAAIKAGINDSVFSWKTRMHILPNKVVVSAGYRAAWVTIWEKE